MYSSGIKFGSKQIRTFSFEIETLTSLCNQFAGCFGLVRTSLVKGFFITSSLHVKPLVSENGVGHAYQNSTCIDPAWALFLKGIVVQDYFTQRSDDGGNLSSV